MGMFPQSIGLTCFETQIPFGMNLSKISVYNLKPKSNKSDPGMGLIFFPTLLFFGGWLEFVWGVAITPLWFLGTPLPVKYSMTSG